jgi:alpha-N-arabinofuranosidase
MRFLQILFFVAISLNAFAQSNSVYNEYHVSVNGNDVNDGSVTKPFKTIMAAANAAMPGDVIMVHAGVYREQITPPRGGNSEAERIAYQAASGEKSHSYQPRAGIRQRVRR